MNIDAFRRNFRTHGVGKLPRGRSSRNFLTRGGEISVLEGVQVAVGALDAEPEQIADAAYIAAGGVDLLQNPVLPQRLWPEALFAPREAPAGRGSAASFAITQIPGITKPGFVPHHRPPHDPRHLRGVPLVAEPRPHITVSHHDQYGVVAAASHENHVADHMLRLVGFERLPGSDLYTLTEPNRHPTRRGGQAVQSLRTAHYNVTSDATYDVKPYTRLNPSRGLLHRLDNTAVAFDAYIRGDGHPEPTPSTQQRRAQAATAVSPARACATLPQPPSTSVEYRPAPATQQPVPTR